MAWIQRYDEFRFNFKRHIFWWGNISVGRVWERITKKEDEGQEKSQKIKRSDYWEIIRC